MAADEMKKNVEKLDELEDALKRAQEELIVCSIYFYSVRYIPHKVILSFNFLLLSNICIFLSHCGYLFGELTVFTIP